MKKIFDKMNMKKLKNGSYSILLSIAVTAIAVVINLIVNEIPSQYTKFDMSDQKLYSIGGQTKRLVQSLNQDITIYYVVQNNNEDSTIEKMLERYEDLSSHIKVVKKDPVINPNFTSKYTQEQLSENSLIVESGDKSKVLEYSTLYETQMDYQTYQSETTGFDGEGQLTSAISYVTSDNTAILYQVEGHGEQALPSTLTSSVEKENIDLASLSLLTQESVPEDAAAIVICAPAGDFSEEEKQKVLSYLENGGKALIFSEYTTEEMPNFASILESYGVKTVDGIVFEGDNQHYYQQPYYLVPDFGDSEITAELISNKRNVLAAGSQGIQKLDNYRDTLVIESLISTTDSAYSKTDVENMTQIEKEEKDIAGPFDLGVAVSETSEDKETQLVYYSSFGILDESANQMVSGGNMDLIMNSITWMCKDGETSIAIASKSLEMNPLTLTQFQSSIWTVITLIIIPGTFLICGFVIWFRRRKQ